MTNCSKNSNSHTTSNFCNYFVQCFDAVGWAAGRASGLWKTERWGAGMIICLEWGADLHMSQLIPLPLTVSCFSKIQIGFTFLVLAHLGSPRKRAVKWVCVCVCLYIICAICMLIIWGKCTPLKLLQFCETPTCTVGEIWHERIESMPNFTPSVRCVTPIGQQKLQIWAM